MCSAENKTFSWYCVDEENARNATYPRYISCEWRIIQSPVLQVILVPLVYRDVNSNLHPVPLRFVVAVHWRRVLAWNKEWETSRMVYQWTHRNTIPNPSSAWETRTLRILMLLMSSSFLVYATTVSNADPFQIPMYGPLLLWLILGRSTPLLSRSSADHSSLEWGVNAGSWPV